MKQRLGFLWIVMSLMCGAAFADAEQGIKAHYLGNAGVMVAKGETKILFDPFFRNDYGMYDLVPENIEKAIFAGAAPWDGIDAIFISHHHDDHFDPALMIVYLQEWPEVELFAPQQAVDDLLEFALAADNALLSRINGLEPNKEQRVVTLKKAGLIIEAVEVAHAGWPSRNTKVDNLAFRVTLDDATTVVHMGDADKARELYEPDTEYWQARSPRLAFAPIWLFLTDPGKVVLEEFVGADQSIGVHVYKQIPDAPEDRPPNFAGVDIFTQPGETREIE